MDDTWNKDRWVDAGKNEAGDQMYERNLKAGEPDSPQLGKAQTKKELQAELEKRGLPTSGTKDELLERLGA